MGRNNQSLTTSRYSRRWHALLIMGASVVALGAATAAPALAADKPAPAGKTAQTDSVVEEVVVTGARNMTGVIQKRDSAVAFGIDKALVDTPRSVTAISDQLLDRYNIKSVYDFTAVAAGTYTGSYFGVPGSLNIRGTIADNYFNGFKTITNFATYPTPVDASSNIDLVRGPPSPVYGAGHIGGYLNFIPKSARGDDAKYLDHATGAMSFTYGSYNDKEGTLEGGVPLKLAGHDAGLYGFVEVTDSDSFYYREHPKSQTAQLTFSTDLPDDWSFSATAQYINSDGYLKDIGWNRVTQNLIDNGTYVSGSPIAQIATPGAAYITSAAFAAAKAHAAGGIQQYVLPLYGIYATPNQYTELNPATVSLVKLSPRQTAISSKDINRANTPMLYLGLTKTFGDFGTLKLESFSQYLDALNYQSYGFATQFRTAINEERVTYNDKRSFGDNLLFQTAVGVAYRYTNAYSATYLNSGVNVQDRWDLSKPQTADEIFNAVYGSKDHGRLRWDNAVRSTQSDISVFLLEDILLFNHLDITGGVRNDNYSLTSIDEGVLAPTASVTERTSPISYNISVSIKNPWVVPYFTYAESYSLNEDQGNALAPSLVAGRSAVGEATLTEAGLKTSQFNGRLYASVDLYRQKNQFYDFRTNAVNSQLAQGFEGELRYLATKYLGLTGTVTIQHVRQLPGDGGNGPFLIITPEQAGITGVQGYGGMFETNAKFLGLGNGYDLHTTPRLSASLFATYDYKGFWGLTGGATYNSWTGGSIPGSIRLPGYTLVKLGGYVMFKGVRADVYVDNLFDQRYFIAEYDVDSNATVLPGVGREIHVKLSKRF